MKAKPEPGLFDALEPARPRESHTSGRFVHVALDRPLREDSPIASRGDGGGARHARRGAARVRREVGVVVGSRRPRRSIPAKSARSSAPSTRARSSIAICWISPRGSRASGSARAAKRSRRCSRFAPARPGAPPRGIRGVTFGRSGGLVGDGVEGARPLPGPAHAPRGGELPMGVLLKSTKLSTSPVRTLERRGLRAARSPPAGADPLLLVKGWRRA